MAEIKISALGGATSLTGTETVPVVQSGTTKKATTQAIAGLMSAAVATVSAAVDTERTARQADVASINAVLSEIISAGGGAISVTSAEVQVVSAQAASALDVVRNTTSALQVSVDLVADLLSKEISNRLSSYNAVSAMSVGGVPTAGLQSAVNALSNRISAIVIGVVSATSAKIQTASAAATSADGHANTVSVALAAELANRVSAVNVVSAVGAALSLTVSTHTTSLAAVSAAQASLANVVSGIIAAGGAGVSVISAEAQQISADANSARNALSVLFSAEVVNRVSAVNTVSLALVNEINNRVSAFNVNREGISTVSVAIAAETANRLSADNAFSILLSVAAMNTFSALSTINQNISTISVKLDTLSLNFTSLVNRVSANSATGGGGGLTTDAISTMISLATSAVNKVSARSIPTTVSVQGLQSALNSLSYRISVLAAGGGGGSGSVTSNEASAISAQAASAINALSIYVSAVNLSFQQHDILITIANQNIAALSLLVSALGTSVNVASLAATSADAHANFASVAATSVDNRVNTLIDRVSANSAAFSLLLSVVNNALSAGDVISNQLSVLSAGIGRPQIRLITTGIQTISASGLTKVSGLSVSVVTGGVYQVKAVIVHGHSAQGTNAFGFGLSGPTPTMAAGRWMGFVSVQNAGATPNTGYFTKDGFGSVTYSATPSASATMYRTELDMLLVNSVAGTIQLKARTSAATVGAIDIQVGSYIQAFRIG